jgi:hypothetical protein
MLQTFLTLTILLATTTSFTPC